MAQPTLVSALRQQHPSVQSHMRYHDGVLRPLRAGIQRFKPTPAHIFASKGRQSRLSAHSSVPPWQCASGSRGGCFRYSPTCLRPSSLPSLAARCWPAGDYQKDDTGFNACGFGRLPDRWEKYYGALPVSQFRASEHCGKCIRVRGTQAGASGKWVKVSNRPLVVSMTCTTC